MQSNDKKIQPKQYAVILAVTYFFVAVASFEVLHRLGHAFFTDTEQLETFFFISAAVSIFFTSVLLYLLWAAALRRVSKSAELILLSREALVASERRAIGALLAASIVHDFNKILTILRLNTERLKTLPGLSGEAVHSIGKLDQGVCRLTDLVLRLRKAEQKNLAVNLSLIDLVQTAEETLEFVRHHQSLRRCEARLVGTGPVWVKGCPVLLHQLLINLILNAAEAAESHGRVLIHVTQMGGAAVLEVHDSGPGVPEELHEKIFEAFYTTKKDGTGLGLMSVKACADSQGARVDVSRSSLGGAVFRVVFPEIRPPAFQGLFINSPV